MYMNIKIRQVAAVAALVGALGVGGAQLAAAQEDSTTTTEDPTVTEDPGATVDPETTEVPGTEVEPDSADDSTTPGDPGTAEETTPDEGCDHAGRGPRGGRPDADTAPDSSADTASSL
jgi:hypothetical protein